MAPGAHTACTHFYAVCSPILEPLAPVTRRTRDSRGLHCDTTLVLHQSAVGPASR